MRSEVLTADPAAVFRGTLVFAVPHMDDEVLACGGTIARLPCKDQVHVVYATDGSRSPIPTFPWMAAVSSELPRIRRAEARSALEVLGVPAENGHFLDFPDGGLQRHVADVREAIGRFIDRVQPSHVFVPFRYDRHADHLALHHAVLLTRAARERRIQLVEYFVYYRWRMLPGGDVRAFIRPEHLIAIDIRQQGRQKRCALRCYESQTTRFFDWQDRPILPAERVEEVSRSPELFVHHDPDYPGRAILSRLQHWIPVAHRLEPPLKRTKDELRMLLGARAVRARH